MERQRQKDRKERRLIGIVHVFSGGKSRVKSLINLIFQYLLRDRAEVMPWDPFGPLLF